MHLNNPTAQPPDESDIASGDVVMDGARQDYRKDDDPSAAASASPLAADSSAAKPALTRRGFLSWVGGTTSAAIATGALGTGALAGCGLLPAPLAPLIDDGPGPITADARALQAYRIRVQAARSHLLAPRSEHRDNGDEVRYERPIASFSKGLPHDERGEVEAGAYAAYLDALDSGDPADFENIPMGSPEGGRLAIQKLVNPQAGLAFDMEGADAQYPTLPPAPTFDSAEEAGEIVECWWMALLRDVPFSNYVFHPLARQAADELSGLGDFRGPKQSGRVTPDTLFRGTTAGDLNGPFISQFLWRPAPFGSQFVDQRMRAPAAGRDFMTQYDEWLNIQNGLAPSAELSFAPVRRYIVTGRDLSQWVHVDVLFQAYFNACLILITPPDADLTAGGIGAPLNVGNPYNESRNQIGFGTLGAPFIKTLMCEVATRALKTVWFQKWFVHRRLRPEEFAGRVHQHMTGAAEYPIHAEALNATALDELFARHGSYLLPMAFPEGCPMHPAYGAGHATVAGACVTILKAMFDESFVIPNPMMPDPVDPTRLVAYDGPPLTVGGELNKLASNVALGRGIAGVHWRSDVAESLRLGEAVAIHILRDQMSCFNERLSGFTFTTFDGETITV
ncbi:MAG: vanadium-dependent haloperoxidase [Phycisphaerae bacterium]|nr:vanadium-dependent haloperoxidase [Phycisphaerae bacterium]